MPTDSSFREVPHKGMITLFTMMATIMQVLDTTIANVALPHMQGSLSATQDQVSWVLTSYIVASAIMTLPSGWLAGRFGRRRIMLWSIAGFTVTSVLCGLTSSITEMVICRLLQGAFGAALVPLSQAILLDINPKEKHGSAMALWGVGIMIGPILGPTLGGYLTEFYNWRWVFFINLPVGILSFMGIYYFLSESIPHDRPFDLFGFLTLSIAIGGAQLILDQGEHEDWFESTEIIVYAGIVIGTFWMYLIHSRYAKHPFLSLEIFLDRNFLTALIMIFFVGSLLISSLALLPPMMQYVMGYPVLDIGLLMAPRGAGAMIMMALVGKLSSKVDPRRMIFVGLILVAFSLWQMSHFASFTPPRLLIISGFIQGLGFGLIMVPLSTIAFATLGAQHRAEAAGLFSLVRNIGSSMGVSFVVAMLSKTIQRNHSYLAESVTPYLFNSEKKFLPYVMHDQRISLSVLDLQINQEASMIGYINDFSMMMWMVIILTPMIFLLKNPFRPKVTELPAMVQE